MGPLNSEEPDCAADRLNFSATDRLSLDLGSHPQWELKSLRLDSPWNVRDDGNFDVGNNFISRRSNDHSSEIAVVEYFNRALFRARRTRLATYRWILVALANDFRLSRLKLLAKACVCARDYDSLFMPLLQFCHYTTCHVWTFSSPTGPLCKCFLFKKRSYKFFI